MIKQPLCPTCGSAMEFQTRISLPVQYVFRCLSCSIYHWLPDDAGRHTGARQGAHADRDVAPPQQQQPQQQQQAQPGHHPAHQDVAGSDPPAE